MYIGSGSIGTKLNTTVSIEDDVTSNDVRRITLLRDMIGDNDDYYTFTGDGDELNVIYATSDDSTLTSNTIHTTNSDTTVDFDSPTTDGNSFVCTLTDGTTGIIDDDDDNDDASKFFNVNWLVFTIITNVFFLIWV